MSSMLPKKRKASWVPDSVQVNLQVREGLIADLAGRTCSGPYWIRTWNCNPADLVIKKNQLSSRTEVGLVTVWKFS